MKPPKFKSEAEEAEWLYDNREKVGEEFAQAMREGRTTPLTPDTRGSLSARVAAAKAKSINIRLSERDLQLARELADKKGLPYQTYIKSLLHEVLQREANRNT